MAKSNSVWGEGEGITIDCIEREVNGGRWLDLAAGDGRYAEQLIGRTNELILADINNEELRKAQKLLQEKFYFKIKTSIFDMTKTFPFDNKSFDGVFFTGTLHLFDEERIRFILSEIKRILKQNGKIILDFAVNVRRYDGKGKLVKLNNKSYDYGYGETRAKEIIENNLKDYQLIIKKSTFEDDLTNVPRYGFKTRGEFLLVLAKRG